MGKRLIQNQKEQNKHTLETMETESRGLGGGGGEVLLRIGLQWGCTQPPPNPSYVTLGKSLAPSDA